MKIGQIVAVCHEGKWGRRIKGEVIATKNGNRILVKFKNPIDNTPVVFWARKHKTIHYEKTRGSCTLMKQYSYFAGWADMDYFCPWFKILKWSDSDYKEKLKDMKFLWKHGIYI